MPPVLDIDPIPPSPSQELPAASVKTHSMSSVPSIPSLNSQNNLNEIAPATVSPLHTSSAVPAAQIPTELVLTTVNYSVPQPSYAPLSPSCEPLPDAVICFEGQQFHYLDPTTFDQHIRSEPVTRVVSHNVAPMKLQGAEDYKNLSDVSMVYV